MEGDGEEGLVAPEASRNAVPFGYDEDYMRNDLMKLVKKNNIYISPSLTTLNIYNLLLALGIIENNPIQSRGDYENVGYGDDGRSINRRTNYGILGWEIAYTPSSWVEKITGDDWNPRYNPILLKNRTWIYHIEEVRASTINRTIKMIRKTKKNGKRVWTAIYPQLLELFEDDAIEDVFNEMITRDEYDVAMIGWQNHMRFLYKNDDKKSISFFDPWMQTLDKQPFFHNIQNSLWAVHGYTSKFIRRREDQSEENSCVIDSLARALMVAEYGEEAAKWEWNERTYDYALLAARIIHMNMN